MILDIALDDPIALGHLSFRAFWMILFLLA
jgi:hypothetical protein